MTGKSAATLLVGCVLSVLLFAGSATAQGTVWNVNTPPIPGASQSNNIYALAFSGGFGTVQLVYPKAFLNNLSGDVTEFGLQMLNATNSTWPNIKIKMGETTFDGTNITGNFIANFNHGPSQYVYDGPLTVATTAPDQYWRLPMQTPFHYTGAQNLLVQIEQHGSFSGNSGTVRAISGAPATTGLARVYNTSAVPPTATTGTVGQPYSYGATFTFLQQVPGSNMEVREVKINNSINKPELGNNIVQAVIRNNGTVDQSNQQFTLEYSANGGTNWTTQTFTRPSFAPLASVTVDFTVPWNVVNPGVYTLEVRINPNIGSTNQSKTATWSVFGVPFITPVYQDGFEAVDALDQYGVLLGSRARIKRGTLAGNPGNGVILESSESTSSFGDPTPVDIDNPSHRAILDDPTQWSTGGALGIGIPNYVGVMELNTNAPFVQSVNVSFDLRIVREVAFGTQPNYYVGMVFEYSADAGMTWQHVVDPTSAQQGPTGVYRVPTASNFVPQSFSIGGFNGDPNLQIRFRFRWYTRLKSENGTLNTYFGIDNFKLEVPFTITTSSIPSATATVPYEYENGPISLSHVSGQGALSWTANPHPAWMQLDPATGEITGMPAASDAGLTSITFTAVDSTQAVATRVIDLLVKPAPSAVAITNLSNLPEAAQGVPYIYSMTAFGGAPVPFGSTTGQRYTWEIVTNPQSAWLSIDPATGALSGVAPPGSLNSTVNFTAIVKDQLHDLPAGTPNNTATRQFFIHIVEEMTVMTSSIDLAQGGATFLQQLVAAGGTAPYSWTIASGTLPPGIVFEPNTGRIMGAPLLGNSGTYPLTFLVSDAGVQSTTVNLTMVVAAAPATDNLQITSTQLDPDTATETQPYEAFISASGGVPPYSWTVPVTSADQLPPGMTIDQFGRILGTPFAGTARSYTVTVQITDSNRDEFNNPAPQVSTQVFTFEVQSQISPPTIITTQLQTAEVGFTYPPAIPFPPANLNAPALRVQGGSTPFTWTLVSGELPQGLNFSPIGLIAGVPQVGAELESPYSLTISVTDALGNSHQRSYLLEVLPFSGTPIQVIQTTPPAAVEGQGYSFRITASGGANPTGSTLPYVFRRISGSLPSGLDLDPFGQIRGTPEEGAAGAYTINVEARDAAGHTAIGEVVVNVIPPIGGGGSGVGGGPQDTLQLDGSGSGCSVYTGGGTAPFWLVTLSLLAIAAYTRRRRATS